MRILLVEDNVWMLELLEMVLIDEGYQVKSASNGDEALSIAREHCFDLIVSDVHMPAANGIDFGLSFRKFNSSTYILYFSAEPDGATTYEKEIKQIGNADFIEDKNIAHLLTSIKRIAPRE
jgi:DNA-binding response OmpR family regulator